MKKLVPIVTLLLCLILLCSCGSSFDPFVDLSTFDSTREDVLNHLGKPTKSDDTYQNYSYLGIPGDLVIGFDENNSMDDRLRDILFMYIYPGAED